MNQDERHKFKDLAFNLSPDYLGESLNKNNNDKKSANNNLSHNVSQNSMRLAQEHVFM